MQAVNGFFRDTRFFFKDERIGMYLTVQEAFLSDDDARFLSSWMQLLEQKRSQKRPRLGADTSAATMSLVQDAARFKDVSQMFRLCGAKVDDLELREALLRAWNGTPTPGTAQDKTTLMMYYLEQEALSGHIPQEMVASTCTFLYRKDPQRLRLKLSANMSLRLMAYLKRKPVYPNVGNATFDMIKSLGFVDSRAGFVTLMSFAHVLHERLVQDASGQDFFVWAFILYFGRLLPCNHRKPVEVDPYSYGLGGESNKNRARVYFSATPTDWVNKRPVNGPHQMVDYLKETAHAILSIYQVMQARYANFDLFKNLDTQAFYRTAEAAGKLDQIAGGSDAIVARFIAPENEGGPFAAASEYLWVGVGAYSKIQMRVVEAVKTFAAILWLLAIDRDNFFSLKSGLALVRARCKFLSADGLIVLHRVQH